MLTNLQLVYFTTEFTQSLTWSQIETLTFSESNVLEILKIDPLAIFFSPTFTLNLVNSAQLSYLSLIDIYEINHTRSGYMHWNLARAFFYNFYFTHIIFNFINELFLWTDTCEISSFLFYCFPEVAFIFIDYSAALFQYQAADLTLKAVYDFWVDYNFLLDDEYIAEMLMLQLFGLSFFYLFPNVIIDEFNTSIKPAFTRFYYYYYSLSQELRIQFDTFLLVFIFFLSYWVYLLMTWDEITSEVMIEAVHYFFITFFLSGIGFLVLKYSIHFFAFFEAADTTGRSVFIVIKQFFRDIMGLIGLLLRFLILIFRLNVYDNLDDILDSYYLFFFDFDDHDYMHECFWLVMLPNPYDEDAFTNFFWSLENDLGIHWNFYTLLFGFWAKIALFWLFILEEFLRILLALYISLLISLEVHAVSSSFVEHKIRN